MTLAIQYGLKSAQVTTTELKNIIAAFSIARKCLRLGHAIEPMQSISDTVQQWQQKQEQDQTSAKRYLLVWMLTSMSARQKRQLLNDSLSALNDLSDDVICLIKIGALSKQKWNIVFYERLSTYLWLTCIMLDIFEFQTQNGIYRTLALPDIYGKKTDDIESATVTVKQQLQRFSILKLFADLGFCIYDLLMIDGSQVQTLCGFSAAYCGVMKLILKAQLSKK